MKRRVPKPTFVVGLALVMLIVAVSGRAQTTQWQLAMQDQAKVCSAARGELAPESTDASPVLRFGVTAIQSSGWLEFDNRGSGFLYVSRDRIRFLRGADETRGFLLDASRSELKRSKEWTVVGSKMGWAELQFERPGKWYFVQLECDGAKSFQDLLDAVENFEGTVPRVKALDETRRQAEAKAKQEAEAKAKQEAEARAAREAAERAAKTATLRVSAQPGGAQVYLDDKFKGVTSESDGVLVIDGLQPASYKVRISSTGYKDWTESATLAGGETRHLQAQLAQAGPKPLTLEEIEKALRDGISNRRVQVMVKEFGVDFTLTDEPERRLRAVGADSDLLLAIAKAKK